MSFLVRLGSDIISVEAGATTPLSVEIINRDDTSDQFELEIEGLDPEWTAIPVPVVTIDAHETQQEKLFFKPQRVSESSAGNYPFVVKVRSLTTGEAKSVQGVLTIKPFHHLSLEISPKKGFISPLRKLNSFDVTVVNLGNTEHTVQFFGTDSEEACAFDFESEQLIASPGQQKTVEVEVTPTNQGFFSGSRLYGFSVSGRSIESPSVVSVAQAQLEQKPLVSVATIIGGLLIAFIVGLWIYLIPKPPTFDMSLDKSSIVRGDGVAINWSTNMDGATIHISAQNKDIYLGPDKSGHQTFVPTFDPSGVPASSFQVEGYAEKDGKQSSPRTFLVQVTDPPIIEDPQISVFTASPTKLNLGDPITFNYSVKNAVKATLLPIGKDLDLSLGTLQLLADNVNTKEYVLVATNSAGKTVRKSVRVSITKASKARVIVFTASPSKVTGPTGTTTLTWQVNDLAVRTELHVDGDIRQIDPTGTLAITVTKTTTVTLICYDDGGLTDQKSIKIEVVAPPPQAITPTTTPPGATTGPGTTTGDPLPPVPGETTTGGGN